ncbi:MAG: hypothetical protein MJE77_13330 [Proteobacteria bacterium]|nr:hypothetical protein [Pseudomonadota bacterium]
MEAISEVVAVLPSGQLETRTIEISEQRYPFASMIYEREYLIGSTLFRSFRELWMLARECFRSVAEQYAATASVAMRAARGYEWLHLAELLLLGGTEELSREALADSMKRMLSSGGSLRQVRTNHSTPLARMCIDDEFWGLPAHHETLGIVMDTGPVRTDRPYRGKEGRLAAQEWGAELGEIDRLVSARQEFASRIQFAFAWGRQGTFWDRDTLEALSRRDVIIIAHEHKPIVGSDEFHIKPAEGANWILGSELLSQLERSSASNRFRQVDISICNSYQLLEQRSLPSRMLMLGLGGLARRNRLYIGTHELITGRRSQRILGREIAFLGSTAPTFATARELVRAVILEELYEKLAMEMAE